MELPRSPPPRLPSPLPPPPLLRRLLPLRLPPRESGSAIHVRVVAFAIVWRCRERDWESDWLCIPRDWRTLVRVFERTCEDAHRPKRLRERERSFLLLPLPLTTPARPARWDSVGAVVRLSLANAASAAALPKVRPSSHSTQQQPLPLTPSLHRTSRESSLHQQHCRQVVQPVRLPYSHPLRS